MNPKGWAKRSLIVLTLLFVTAIHAQSFVNFETAPVHPIALSADGQTLAICNLPASRVELFDVSNGIPRRLGSVFTGLDPVSARFNSRGELWVINHTSDTISIIDPANLKVIATLDTFLGPADVVFTSRQRAFVSHAIDNVVEIWNVTNRVSLGSIDIDGDRPKAMALSADESEIYVAILESGNASTIIAPPMTGLNRTPQPSASELPNSPQHGLNPAPNFGDIFSPAINTNIPSSLPPPRVSLIVRKQQGRWLDDNHGDWTEYISGTNAFLTGRAPGWDIADHDIAVINTTNGAVRYIRGLMNICFDLSVNPATGKIALIGTDAINEVRFEPVLQSIFIRMKLALVDPQTSTSDILDLNPHLDYKTRSLPTEERRQSVGDPRGIAWNSRGTRAYVTGMGSDNLIVLDQNGARIGPAIPLPAGPTGLVMDDARNRLYVFCRFDSKLVTLDADTLSILATASLPDPTPAAVRIGRKHFYNTLSSGLGQAACASCHIDGRFDRLAWDLGDQTGDVVALTNRNLFLGDSAGDFHPMKGPMVTQSLVDIIGHEPFHWRGDRSGIEEFNPTFVALQGADSELTDEEMQEFEDFLATLTFPPNRQRNLDNSLPTSLTLFSERTLGHDGSPPHPLPDGNAIRGRDMFRSVTQSACLVCHTLPTGLGPDAAFSLRWLPKIPGKNGEHHVGMTALERSLRLPFKVQHLRNLFDKIGFNLNGPVSRAGFGFMHDGRVDTLTRFLQDGFDLLDEQRTADLIAFLMAFTGSDLPPGSIINVNSPPGLPARDVSAGVGLQVTLTNSISNSRLLFMMSHARSATSRVDLVAHGFKNGLPRGWLMSGTFFNSDKPSEAFISSAQLLAFAAPSSPVTFTFVPRQSGQRLAIDRDGDGFANQTEIEAGSDPDDPNVTPETTTPRLVTIQQDGTNLFIKFFGKIGAKYKIESCAELTPNSGWADFGESLDLPSNPGFFSETIEPAATARFFRIAHVP